jgi:SOS-response transcriptional repressor LexA
VTTPAQAHVLVAVRDVGADGWPVTTRDLMRATGYASPSTVHKHVAALERAGLIERNPRGDGWRIRQEQLA